MLVLPLMEHLAGEKVSSVLIVEGYVSEIILVDMM